MVLICIFLMTNNSEHLFMCHYIFSLLTFLFKPCTYFFLTGLFFFLLLCFDFFLYFGYSSSLDMFCKYSLYPVASFFISLTMFIEKQKILILMNSNLPFFFPCMGYTFSIVSETSLFNLRSKLFSPYIFF